MQPPDERLHGTYLVHRWHTKEMGRSCSGAQILSEAQLGCVISPSTSLSGPLHLLGVYT